MVGLVPLISCDTLSISNTVGRRDGCSINIDADHQLRPRTWMRQLTDKMLYTWGVDWILGERVFSINDS
jgi:hypothetical protein